jgi:proline racemase
MRWNRVLNVVGTHSGGEYARIVTSGIADPPGATMFDKRTYLQDHADHYRQRLLFEPCGSVLHSADVLLPSNNPDAQLGYVILESTEYPAMSGSNTISVATVILETGIVDMVEPVTELVLEAPAGLIRLHCECKDGKVTSVTFVNQPAFAVDINAPLEVEGLGTVYVDTAWGGMAYVLASADELGFALVPTEARDLSVVGEKIKAAAVAQLTFRHPEFPEYPGITQTEIVGPVQRKDDGLHSRNAVVVRPGRLDRSACGTGTSARLAVLHARGLIDVGERLYHESVLGSQYIGVVVSLARVGSLAAVIPSITGTAWITDMSYMGVDPSDPFPLGYTLPDTWAPR